MGSDQDQLSDEDRRQAWFSVLLTFISFFLILVVASILWASLEVTLSLVAFGVPISYYITRHYQQVDWLSRLAATDLYKKARPLIASLSVMIVLIMVVFKLNEKTPDSNGHADAPTSTESPTRTSTVDLATTPASPTDDIASSTLATPTSTMTTPAPTIASTATTEAPTAISVATNGVSDNAEWEPYSPEIQELDGIEMVLVPVGCFMMGTDDQSTPQCFDEPFWIDRTEVTRAQYAECDDSGSCPSSPSNSYATRDNQPINQVNWFQARNYCRWRNSRLPTEAEWEYAARGPSNLDYPSQETIESGDVVYSRNSGNTTANVGSRPNGASWVGAVDMSGNVWEWVSTIYDENGGREDPEDTSAHRILRGGGFNDTNPENLLATTQHQNNPYVTGDAIGFRCAMDFLATDVTSAPTSSSQVQSATPTVPIPTTPPPPSSPSTTVPSIEPTGNANLRIIASENELILQVTADDSISLEGFQYRVIVDGLTTFPLTDYFDVLLLNNGIAAPRNCFILQRSNSNDVLPTGCNPAGTFRQNLNISDVFWYDDTRNSGRSIAVYQQERRIVTCSALTNGCAFTYEP